MNTNAELRFFPSLFNINKIFILISTKRNSKSVFIVQLIGIRSRLVRISFMIEKNQSHDTVFLLISLGADRCLRFNYVISDRNVGSSAVTSLNVYVMGDSGTTAPPYVFDTNTGNSWVQAEIDLPSMENMKVILYPSTPPHPKNKKNQYLIFITKSFIRRLISVNDFFHTVLFLM